MATEFEVIEKLASTKNDAGPSAPGRGSRGATNDGLPVKLPNWSGVGPRLAGLKPPPMLTASSAGLASFGPLPEKRFDRSVILLGKFDRTPVPIREADWSWFCQKMLFATLAIS